MPEHKLDNEKSIYLDREEHLHRGELGAKRVALYSYDAGTDTLEPFNGEKITATRLDDTSTADVTYIGKAEPGTAAAEATWQIAKLETSSGLIKTWADGDALYNNIWDNRTSLTYV